MYYNYILYFGLIQPTYNIIIHYIHYYKVFYFYNAIYNNIFSNDHTAYDLFFYRKPTVRMILFIIFKKCITL